MPRTHRRYDEEFKRQAVELYLHSNNSLKQVARELGISDGSLRKWHGIIKLGTKYLLTTAILGLPYCSVKWTPGSSRVGPPAE